MSITVQQIGYRGWAEAVEISNGLVRAVVVPSIGRIMHYGYTGEDNLLYENPNLYGQTLHDGKPLDENGQPVWAAFGGDRIWPSQEDMFDVINGHKRPPDHWIDGLPWEATLLETGVEIISQVSDYCGARVIRQIELTPNETHLSISQRMEKVKSAKKAELEPLPLTIWSITKIKPPSQTFVSLNPNSCFPEKLMVPFWGDYDNQAAKNCRLEGDVGIFLPDAVRLQKMGTDAPRWVAAIVDRTVIAEFFSYDPEAVYPDGGTSVTVFTCPDLTELECLSPLTKPNIGDAFEYTITWDLFQLPAELTTPQEKRQAAVKWLNSRQ